MIRRKLQCQVQAKCIKMFSKFLVGEMLKGRRAVSSRCEGREVWRSAVKDDVPEKEVRKIEVF